MKSFDRKLISRSDASLKYSRSGTTMWRDERDAIIPPAIKINGRKFWVESELDDVYFGSRDTQKVGSGGPIPPKKS